VRGKTWISVRNYSLREAEPLIDILKVELGYSFARDGG
jgi:hypothetical protein